MSDCSTIILYRENKKVLLQHRTKNEGRMPDYWGLFGGGIEEGEEPRDAAKREMTEETRYTLKDPQYAGHVMVGSDTIHGFIEQYDGVQEIVIDHESQDFGWYTVEEAKKLKIIPHDLELIKKAVSSL